MTKSPQFQTPSLRIQPHHQYLVALISALAACACSGSSTANPPSGGGDTSQGAGGAGGGGGQSAAAGGQSNAAGSSSKATGGTGGDSAAGGSAATGGSTSSLGGTLAAGGAPITGGRTSSGGSVASGGVAVSGATSTGGKSGGGTGGISTGGKPSGGASNSGVPTGGAAGAAAGGAPTGGAATGGTPTTSAGGSATCPADNATYLTPVDPAPYKVSSTLWKARLKSMITSWVPWVASQLSNTSLAEGGIANFVEAGKKLKGQTAAQHVGLWFSNAYVLQEVEAMSAALMVDPEGDTAITNAQNAMKTTLADWIPKIVSAQESDGYLQTIITLGSATYGNPGRWTDRFFHEGYVAGYFLEAAVMHNLATGDATLYNAAKKLADCWVTNIGASPKKLWWDGHEEMEQALTRFARFVNEKEGAGTGDKYAQLAKFLLDSRGKAGPGTDANDPGQTTPEYDQHQAAPLSQTTAVGHAVRAMYLYSGMTDVAMVTGSSNYLSAADTIWDDLVNRKMYVNACVGSGDTDEGFGNDYSLPNTSYCESCSSCGMLFFQHKMTLAHKDGRYADLSEIALYNTIMGSVDLAGSNFEYTNPLDQNFVRYTWHPCPCCVGNVPRTLLEIPRWTYAKSDATLYVNQFVGGTMSVGTINGTAVQVVQATDYPWSGSVSITVNPAAATAFAVKIRVPDRSVSSLYTSTPDANGITSVAVNGATVTPTISNGYATICRTWTAGDEIDLVLPLAVQRVKAVSNVAADVGRVALQYGPLIYNIENVDYSADVGTFILSPSAALTAQWNGSLLNGLTTITGKFTNGTAMTAIPHYARMNRGGTRSIVWIKDQ